MPILVKIAGANSLREIALAIGKPATEKDTKSKLAQIIDSAQADIAKICNEKGCSIPENPTFPDIVNGLNTVGHFVKSEQVQNLTATTGFSEAGKVVLEWTNPTDDKFAGVKVVYKSEDYPKNETDGITAYDSNNTLPVKETVEITELTDGVKYYFRAFAYTIRGSERIYTDTTLGAQCTATPVQLKGQKVFTSSATWNIPYGVTNVDIFLVGGGGSGTRAMFFDRNSCPNSGGGGGGGYTKTVKNVSVTPNTSVNILVGAGGATSTSGDVGNTGGCTNVTIGNTTFTAEGGAGGGGDAKSNWPSHGGSGGSSGGNGITFTDNMGGRSAAGENGFMNGGGHTNYPATSTWGQGQYVSTAAFGEENATLYAGGGGGGSAITRNTFVSINGGIGGTGGGGNGGSIINKYPYSIAATSGTPGTGGGGGGAPLGLYYDGNMEAMHNSNGAAGGSGIVIIRWGY